MGPSGQCSNIQMRIRTVGKVLKQEFGVCGKDFPVFCWEKVDSLWQVRRMFTKTGMFRGGSWRSNGTSTFSPFKSREGKNSCVLTIDVVKLWKMFGRKFQHTYVHCAKVQSFINDWAVILSREFSQKCSRTVSERWQQDMYNASSASLWMCL